MVATKLDGTAIAKAIREKIGAEIAERQKLNPRFKPCLKIIQGAFFSSVSISISTLKHDQLSLGNFFSN